MTSVAALFQLRHELRRAFGQNDVALEDNGILTLSDNKGNIVLVPAAKIAYVELSSTEPRRIGFGT